MKKITQMKTIKSTILVAFIGFLLHAQEYDSHLYLQNQVINHQTVSTLKAGDLDKDQTNFYQASKLHQSIHSAKQSTAQTIQKSGGNMQRANGSFPCDETLTAGPFDSNNAFAGNMFDVTTSGGEDIMIDGFEVNLTDAGTQATVRVYYRTDSYVGNEDSSTGWTLLGTDVVTSQGQDNPTYVDIGNLFMPAGETYGFYVSLVNYSDLDLRYTNITGTTTANDGTILITTGVGKGTPEFTGTTFPNRRWNGRIYYSTADCDNYCGPVEMISEVEPITQVQFAGLFGNSVFNNGTIDGVYSHQYWLDIESEFDFLGVSNIIQQVTPGQTYPMAIAGNTNGNWTNHFAVFIDWNQNGILDDAGEVYLFSETLQNSNGTDDQFATHDIEVPANALPGNTRMRIIKQWGTTGISDPCTGADYGHVLDFEIKVVPPAPGTTPCQESLTGHYNSYLWAHGNMFDITNNYTEDITLEAFDINLFNQGATVDAEITVYYIWGSHIGFEQDPSAWTIMGQQTIPANTATQINEPTKIDQLTPLTIAPGEVYGIYITVSNEDAAYMYTSLQTQARYYYNEHILLESGSFSEYPDFSTAASEAAVFNGTVFYCVGEYMSTNQPEAAFHFNFYPNPAQEVLYLQAMHPMEHISIYNINGQEVLNDSPNTTESQLDISHLNHGLYLMSVTSNGKTQTHKLLVK
mgnify:CR=1 FL=1